MEKMGLVPSHLSIRYPQPYPKAVQRGNISPAEESSAVLPQKALSLGIGVILFL